jgi:peptidoglycan/xylan/chitin deacetylase (PgdA/CDA1 family)
MWLRRIRSRRVPILYYHEIGPDPSKHVVHPEDFAAQLDWLRSTGHEFLTLDDVLDLYAGRRDAPARPVVLTFDDGRAGVLRHAAPALAGTGLPATLYLVTDWLDGRGIPDGERYSGFVGWGDLPELREAGVRIGSHGVSHRTLKRLPPHEVDRELRDSRRLLEDKLGQPILHFSFPRGRATRAVERRVRHAGYRSAVATGQSWNGPLARMFHLQRLGVDGRASLDDFAHMLSSR